MPSISNAPVESFKGGIVVAHMFKLEFTYEISEEKIHTN